MSDGLPFGWVMRPNGDIWSEYGPKAKPIMYSVADKFMIAGMRSAEEIAAILQTVHTRLPDLREQLEQFNAEREALLSGQPIDVESRMPLPRSGVGGDVDEPS